MGSNISISKEIEKYIDKHSLKLHPVQNEIIAYNEKLGDIKRNQISISQCHFLHLLIKTSSIKKILEIGTFTGLSALSMLLALPEDGKLLTLDKNKNTTAIAYNFFKKATLLGKAEIIIENALKTIEDLKIENKKFDLVFIDADKENYKIYYDKSLNLIDKNGLIVVDNVLWHGDVADITKKDKLTRIIREFNTYVNEDKRTENIIIPLGDGLTICRKL